MSPKGTYFSGCIHIKELSQELKNSIILLEEEMKDYLPKEVKE